MEGGGRPRAPAAGWAAALKALDHEGLRAALIEKKVVSSEQQILEAARLRHLTHAAAQCMGRDGAPTLREIIDAVGEPWASQITEIRSQLQRRLGRVRQLHEANRALALSGQRTVSQALGHLGRKRADTYATNGQIRHGSVKRSVVVL